MATRTVSARVKIDGEKEYKAAIASINQGNKVLGSEMKKLQAQYKGNTESTEFLTKKGELLERQLYSQKDKVAEVRAAYENASKALSEYIQNNKESGEEYEDLRKYVSNWEIQLNNAEAAQYDLEHAIQENDSALQGEEETMAGLGDTVSDLASKLGIKIPDGAKEALNGMQGLSTGTVIAMSAAVAGITAVVKAVKALHAMTVEAAAEVDELVTESLTTGLSTKTIQTLKYAENLIDVSYSTITSTLTKLTQEMAKAQDGNTALAESFAELGVSIVDTDGNLRSAEDVFYDMIDALGGIENTTERDAIAMELLGKSAQELNPLIQQGSEVLREMAAEAEATGYVLDESQIQKLAEVDDAYQKMQLQIDATKKQLSAEFAPASQAAMELYAGLVQKAGQALKNSGIIEGMASLLQTLANLFNSSKDASRSTLPSLTEKFFSLQSVLGGLAQFAALVADAFNVIAGLAPWNWGSGRLSTALGWNRNNGQLSNWQRVYMQQNGTLAQYESYYGRGQYSWDPSSNRYYDTETGWYVNGNPYGYNAGGTKNWRGGLTWVGESGPELVRLPAGSQVMSAQESRGFGDVFNITIPAKDIKEFNDIVEIARSARVRARMRG